jgi:hypothetical protein
MKEGCIGKPGRYNDRKICGQMPVNEALATPATSTVLSVDYLELKSVPHRKSIYRMAKLKMC